jgi:hypothetical protein
MRDPENDGPYGWDAHVSDRGELLFIDEHLLPDAREVDRAEPGACPRLAHGHPARVLLVHLALGANG